MNETDLKLLCRICLNNSSLCSNIYVGQSSDEIPIYEVINYVYDLEITIDDGLPEYICLDCLGIIKEFESYKTNAHRAKRKLMLLGEKKSVFIKVEKEDYLDSTDTQVTADTETREQQNFQKRNMDDAASLQTSAWSKDANCGIVNYMEFPQCESIYSEPIEKQEPEEVKNWTEEEASYSVDEESDSRDQRISKMEDNVGEKGNIDVNEDDTSESEGDGYLVEEEDKKNSEGQERILVNTTESMVNYVSCHHCGEKKSTQRELQEHIHSLHSTIFVKGMRENDKRRSEKKKHKCSFCNKVFDKRYCMMKHLMTHTGEKPYQCDTCKYRSSRRSDLRTHMYIHTGERPFKCNICDYRTVTRSSLRRHINTHSGWKPFQCKQCDYKTSDVSNFRRHMYTHADKKSL